MKIFFYLTVFIVSSFASAETFDCRPYLFSKAEDSVDHRLQVADKLLFLIGGLPNTKQNLIAKHPQKKQFDLINAVSFMVGEPTKDVEVWTHGNPIPGNYSQFIKESFPPFIQKNTDEYNSFVESLEQTILKELSETLQQDLTVEQIKDLNIYQRVFEIVTDMNTRVCPTCFCKNPKRLHKNVSAYYLHKAYSYNSTEDILAEIKKRLLESLSPI